MDKPTPPRKKGRKKRKAKPKPVAQPAPGAAASDEPSYAVPYDPGRVEAFVQGYLTLGDLEGITKKQQYEMAEVGYGYLTGGKLDEAKVVFEGLVALDPFDAYFLAALGSIAQQTGALEEAESRYSRALEINPFSPFARAHRGEIRINGGRLQEGVADLIRSIEEDPEGRDPATLRARATLAILVKQLEEAGLDAAALKGRTQRQPPMPPPAGVSPEAVKPKIKQIDPSLLEKFAQESELVVTRRGRGPEPEPPAPAPKAQATPEPEPAPEPPAPDPEKTVTVPRAKAAPRRKSIPRKKPKPR